MDIYAKAKYNRPEELSEIENGALKPRAGSEESCESFQMTSKKEDSMGMSLLFPI